MKKILTKARRLLVDEHDPVEAVATLESALAQIDKIEHFQLHRLVYNAHEEASIGSPEKAEHLLDMAIAEFPDTDLPSWDVTIKGTVIKTITVEAENEEQATQLAHEQFSVSPEDGEPEKYNEETLSCVPSVLS